MTFSLSETLIDWPAGRGNGQKQEKKRKRGEESCKIFSYLKNFSSSLSSSSLSLWCNSMCFTGPCWAEDLRWKTSEFWDVFKGTRGPKKSLMCSERSLSSAGLSMTLETLCSLLVWSHVDAEPALQSLSVKHITNTHLAAVCLVLFRERMDNKYLTEDAHIVKLNKHQNHRIHKAHHWCIAPNFKIKSNYYLVNKWNTLCTWHLVIYWTIYRHSVFTFFHILQVLFFILFLPLPRGLCFW